MQSQNTNDGIHFEQVIWYLLAIHFQIKISISTKSNYYILIYKSLILNYIKQIKPKNMIKLVCSIFMLYKLSIKSCQSCNSVVCSNKTYLLVVPIDDIKTWKQAVMICRVNIKLTSTMPLSIKNHINIQKKLIEPSFLTKTLPVQEFILYMYLYFMHRFKSCYHQVTC